MKRVCVACGNRIRWFQGARMSSGLTAKFGPFHLGCWGRWLHGFHAGFALAVSEAHGSVDWWRQQVERLGKRLRQRERGDDWIRGYTDAAIDEEFARRRLRTAQLERLEPQPFYIDDATVERWYREGIIERPAGRSPVLESEGTPELSIAPAATGRRVEDET